MRLRFLAFDTVTLQLELWHYTVVASRFIENDTFYPSCKIQPVVTERSEEKEKHSFPLVRWLNIDLATRETIHDYTANL